MTISSLSSNRLTRGVARRTYRKTGRGTARTSAEQKLVGAAEGGSSVAAKECRGVADREREQESESDLVLINPCTESKELTGETKQEDDNRPVGTAPG